MSSPAVRVVKSRSNTRLIAAAAEFLSEHHETLVIAPTRSAGEEMAHQLPAPGVAGAHRTTLIQLAADLARPEMSKLGLAPLTPLGLEALAARVVHAALREQELHYFRPVAAMPGFGRALARTLGELRLAGVTPETLEACGSPGKDLALLLGRYEAELEERSLADLARVFELATRAASARDHRWAGLPLLSLDTPLDSPAHRELFLAVAGGAPAVFAAVSSGEESFVSALGATVEDLDPGKQVTALDHLRMYLFSPKPPQAPGD